MSNKTQDVREDVEALAQEARNLMADTADVAEEKVVEARARLAAALEKGKEVYGIVRERTITGAKTVDKAVKEHPYQAVGIAFGVGVLIGFLLTMRRRRD